jgi:hypothetical protein
MTGSSSKKGSPAWRRGVERARAQAVALLKRIGPDADKLTEQEERQMHRKLAADLQRLVQVIDRHLAEIPAETPSPPRTTPGKAPRTRGRGRSV